MRNIRIGNDIEVIWSIYTGDGADETAYNLDGRNLNLYLINCFGSEKVTSFDTDGNVLRWRFYGKDQKHIGRYSLILVENEGSEGMHTLDCCDVFNLVRRSCRSCDCGDENVEVLTLDITGHISAVWPSVDDDFDSDSPYPLANATITNKFHLVDNAVSQKVDKEDGKGLSTNDYTTAEKDKLSNIESGAEVNVQSDWNATSGDSFIKNKPSFATVNGYRIDQGGEVDINYQPGISGETVQDYGDIKAGTTAAELEGKSYDEMFNAILFPTVYPTFTAPSVTLSLSGATLREVGASAPAMSYFTTTFNRGAINLLGERQAYRSGALNESQSFMYINGSVSDRALPSTVALGSTKYNYRAYYAAGPQPYDNKGKAYSSPLAAGYVDSNAVTVYGTYPWYATTSGSTGGNPTKQALIKWETTMTTPEFTLLPTDTCTQVITTPREIQEIYIKDTTSGNFILSDLTGFTTTTETKNGRTYYTYTYTGGGRGEITLKIKF